MTARIVVLGSANVDLVVRQPRRAEPGETMFGTSFQTGPGGKGLNQAVAAARAGGDVAFIGAIGDDAFGARCARCWMPGIDTRGLRVTALPTGVAQITVTDDGENAITVVAGANETAELRDPERALIAEASHLVVQLERPEALLIEALRHARAHGVTTVLTPAPARAPIDELLALADVIVPNAGEAALLAGVADAEEAAVSLSRTVPTVVVTRGAEGAVVAQRGEIVSRVPAAAVTAVDTTGAGDTFTGVLVARLAQGAAQADALAAASAAASLTVTRPGAAASMPTRAEIDAALATRWHPHALTPPRAEAATR
ncbi:MAG: ribokinase [Microbacterium sp.]